MHPTGVGERHAADRVELREIFRGQLDVGRAEVAGELLGTLRADDHARDRGLGQHPRQRDLSDGGLVPGGDLAQGVDDVEAAGGHWALRFAPGEGGADVKVGVLLAGECWITAEGAEPVHLATGDCYMLLSGRPYMVASDLETEPVNGYPVFAPVWSGTVYYNTSPTEPGRTILVGGAVHFGDTTAALLLESLPPIARIAPDSHRAQVLRPTLQMLADETAIDSPGSMTMREQLTLILFVQMLRTLLLSGTPTGWLGALNDPSIGAALTLIHKEPARRWTVADLAAAANMSPSAFAQRFRNLIGLPPLDYLARWRMQSAVRVLRTTDRTVASIAAGFGYASESAFSNAFKRVTGRSPSHFRRQSA